MSVAVVAISVSRFAQDDFEKMQSHAKDRGFNFPYLQDLSQEIGRKYGATNTPQVFVLNAEARSPTWGHSTTTGKTPAM